MLDHGTQKELISDRPEEKEYNLNGTDDGEPSEESHGASNEAQLRVRLHFLVSFDLVKCCCAKENLDQL